MVRLTEKDRNIIFHTITADPILLQLLASSASDPGNKIKFSDRLRAALSTILPRLPLGNLELFGQTKQWWSRASHKCQKNYPALSSALAQRDDEKEAIRNRKRNFLRQTGLDWDEADKEKFLASADFKTYHLKRLDTPYPELDSWVVESKEIHNKWDTWIRKGKLADKRRKRYTKVTHAIPENLQLNIPPDENALVYNAETGELVLVVIRQFCNYPDLLKWTDNIAQEAVGVRKSCRLEDPGKLVQLGYSAGARDRPAFHWVRNILLKHLPDDEAARMTRECAHVFGLAWMLFCKKMPSSVIQSFDDWLQHTSIPRMNEIILESNGMDDEIDVNVGENAFVLRNAAGAPPAAVMGVNYARPIHFEYQPHKFGIAWTVARTLGQQEGGHFYLAQYGIRVEMTADTAYAWNPEDAHGTSLQNSTPSARPGAIPQQSNQAGIAFVTSNRLTGVWEKYERNLVTAAQAEEEYATHPPEPIVNEKGELEYFIDRIIGEQRSGRGKRQERKYLVRWMGYGEEEDSWIPYTELKHSAALAAWEASST